MKLKEPVPESMLPQLFIYFNDLFISIQRYGFIIAITTIDNNQQLSIQDNSQYINQNNSYIKAQQSELSTIYSQTSKVLDAFDGETMDGAPNFNN